MNKIKTFFNSPLYAAQASINCVLYTARASETNGINGQKSDEFVMGNKKKREREFKNFFLYNILLKCWRSLFKRPAREWNKNLRNEGGRKRRNCQEEEYHKRDFWALKEFEVKKLKFLKNMLEKMKALWVNFLINIFQKYFFKKPLHKSFFWKLLKISQIFC